MAEPTPLTPHFTLEELTVSDTAVKKGISNLPDDRQRANLVALCQNVLEPLRAALGHPLNVNSGFRSQALNEAIPGSAKKSQHLEGQAADIVCSAMSPLDLFKRIIELGLPYDQLIYERKSPTSVWVHVSHDTAGQRGELLRAVFPPGGGATTYVPLTRSQALALTEPASRGLMLGPPVNTYEEAHDEPDEVVPARKAPAKKAPAKKAPAKKAAAKKAVAKKAPAKKAVAKKAPAKKVVVKQAVAKRSTTKKVAAKKAPAKKVVAKKAPAKKAAKKAAPVRRKR